MGRIYKINAYKEENNAKIKDQIQISYGNYESPSRIDSGTLINRND